jgi:hypothetical protein
MLAGNSGAAAGGGLGFGGLHNGGGTTGAQADVNSWGGQPPALPVDAGQAGANESRGGVGDAGHGGTAGASGGDGSAGSDLAAAGSPDGESQGGNGGAAGASTAGASGDGGSAAGNTSCLADWRSQGACDQCSNQVQPDLRACAVILDCYASKSCGPSSCASTDQECGPNVLRQGSAAYGIAQDVYACLCK